MRKLLPLLVVSLITTLSAYSQCPLGYSPTSLNWDNLDFLVQDPTYISASQAQTQYFAFGTNKVTIGHNYAGAFTSGENGSSTPDDPLSYGSGEDVQFNGDGIITIDFQSAVQNVRFSLFDIDYNQRVTVTASNGAIAQNITMSRLTTAQLTLAGSGTISASATGGATTAVDLGSSDGTVNIDIAGPITSVTITVTQTGFKTNGPKAGQEDGGVWLSDISACSNTQAFPTNYYAVSKPFTNQPGYVLSAIDNSVLMVDPVNGSSKILFTDPSGNNINSIGYDPYNKFLYYTYSLTSVDGTGRPVPNPNDRSIQRYDVNTGQIATVVGNVNTLGIPTYSSGVESGAAGFYDGALYIGIEGINGDESKVWRIDFDASFNPLPQARQVFALPTDEHDWGDFAIYDGVLYDFDGKQATTSPRLENIYHINLQTGATLATYNYAALGFVPRQVAVDWTGKFYNTGTAATTSTGTIAPYNNGVLNTAQQFTITQGTTNPSGSWGDAAEGFRPMVDFGDAPIAYDPDPDAPALHETVDNLRLGGTTDVEWTKPDPGLNADVDGVDEDAIPYAPAMMNNGTYQINVNVFNNSTGNATLIGWLDIDGDNVFEPAEAISAVVPPQSSAQSVSLFWPVTVTSLPSNSYTYLRLRLTSAANNMTTSTPSGYFADGEVEDWRVMVNVTPLAVKLTDFGVRKTEQGQVDVRWNVTGEEAHTRYELQKSADGQHWTGIYQAGASASRATAAYQYVDAAPYQGDNYYRLKITEANEGVQYSAVGKVVFDRTLDVHFTPNPAAGSARLTVQSEGASRASIRLLDMSSRTVYEKVFTVAAGMNQLTVPLEGLAPGVYQAEVLVGNRRYTQKLVVRK